MFTVSGQRNLNTLVFSIRLWVVSRNNMFLHSTTPFYWGVCACVSWCLIPCCSKYLLNSVDRYSPPWSVLNTLIFRLASLSTMCLNNLNFWNASYLCFIKYIHNFLVLSSMKVMKYRDPNNDGIGKSHKDLNGLVLMVMLLWFDYT